MHRLLGKASVLPALLLAVLLGARAQAGQPTWIEMRNENFHAYSSAGKGETQAFLGHLERVRSFFVQVTGAAPADPVPVTVVIFGSSKEYQTYRPNDFAAAYYSNHTDRDFIVVGELGEQSSSTAAHEYTHLVFKHGGYQLPPWLNEGLAELFSTIRSSGSDIDFGDVIMGRLQPLYHEPWVPMETILTADRNSPYYNESQRASSLYNQSWALVHMLATTKPYSDNFWPLVQAIGRGTPSVQALETAYGQPFAQIEHALRSYISGDQFYKLHVKLKTSDTGKLAWTPANPFDVQEIQAELLAGLPGRQAEARTRLEQLAKDNPTRPEPLARLGYLSWYERRSGEAAEYFARAFALGNRSPRLLQDYASLRMHDKPEDAVAALNALISLDAENVEARIMLGFLQMSQRQYAQVLETIRPVKHVSSFESRDNVLLLQALAFMNMQKYTEARGRAEELKRLSTSPDMQQQADSILNVVSKH